MKHVIIAHFEQNNHISVSTNVLSQVFTANVGNIAILLLNIKLHK